MKRGPHCSNEAGGEAGYHVEYALVAQFCQLDALRGFAKKSGYVLAFTSPPSATWNGFLYASTYASVSCELGDTYHAVAGVAHVNASSAAVAVAAWRRGRRVVSMLRWMVNARTCRVS